MTDIQTKRCSNALKAVMDYRKVNVPALAARINVSPRTIEEYTSAKVSLANAKARTVILMAKELNVDPLILIGEKSIEDFYTAEKRRGKKPGRKTLEMLREKNTVKIF